MSQQLSLFEERPIDRVPHTLFFALWPDDKAVGVAQELVQRLQNQQLRLRKPLEPQRLHVTLCGFGGFIGQMPPSLFSQVDVAVKRLRKEPFSVAFGRLQGTNGRAFLLPSSATALRDFESSLRSTLIEGGLKKWLRGRFNPHMTLSYAAEDISELQVRPVTWTVRNFVLVESLQGLHTHIRRGIWHLGADGLPTVNGPRHV